MDKVTRVLLIDDSEDDRHHYTRLLTRQAGKQQFQVFEADTGEAGLTLLQCQSPDCIVLDYSLPGHDGLQVLQQIKQTSPHTPVIMLTGEGNEWVAVESMKNGAQDYLVKDKITSNSLVRALEHAMDRADLQHKLEEQRQELVLFGQMLAHDLKSPIRSIRNLLEFIREDSQPTLQGKPLEYMQMIKGMTNRMDALVDALSAYTKLNRENAKPQMVAMQQVFEAAAANLHQEISDKQARLHCQELPVVQGHTEQLIQLMQNLIGNAIKYCDTTPKLHIDCQQSDDFYRFTIRDNGIGFDPEYCEYIFAPFKRLHSKDKYEGSGIGLATCRKIIERHQGEIYCESEPGVGTTFTFSLPVSS